MPDTVEEIVAEFDQIFSIPDHIEPSFPGETQEAVSADEEAEEAEDTDSEVDQDSDPSVEDLLARALEEFQTITAAVDNMRGVFKQLRAALQQDTEDYESDSEEETL